VFSELCFVLNTNFEKRVQKFLFKGKNRILRVKKGGGEGGGGVLPLLFQKQKLVFIKRPVTIS
jgi:hypothetical protein